MVCPIISGKSQQKAFTFVELMVVMAIIAMLLSIALPRYFDGVERGKETVLREDLATMRDAISHYYGDKGSYPASLQVLVDQRYLRFIPKDPITESTETWEISYAANGGSEIIDIHSGSQDTARDGTLYSTW